jgi:hypothetical protein
MILNQSAGYKTLMIYNKFTFIHETSQSSYLMEEEFRRDRREFL